MKINLTIMENKSKMSQLSNLATLEKKRKNCWNFYSSKNQFKEACAQNFKKNKGT